MGHFLEVGVVLTGIFCAPLVFAGTTVQSFIISGAGIQASGSITLLTTQDPAVDEIIDITGSFTSNAGGFSGAIIGVSPSSYSASNPTENGVSTFDNLFYPSGSAPGLNGSPPGGTLDVYGLDFFVTGGYTVNVWGTGSGYLLSDALGSYVDKDTVVHFVVSPTLTGVVSGGSFEPGIAPGSWITILGANLSSTTDSWSNAIVDGKLPTSLDGLSVSVGGQPAYIAYISPTQINAIAPEVMTGPTSLTVTDAGLTSFPFTTLTASAQPAFFQWGKYAVATHQDYSPAVVDGTLSGQNTIAARPGEVITLWGTGFGETSPAARQGVQVPLGIIYNTADPVAVTIGNHDAVVYGAALAPGYAGLYQVSVQIPASLANGDYVLVATVGDASSPSATFITVHK